MGRALHAHPRHREPGNGRHALVLQPHPLRPRAHALGETPRQGRILDPEILPDRIHHGRPPHHVLDDRPPPVPDRLRHQLHHRGEKHQQDPPPELDPPQRPARRDRRGRRFPQQPHLLLPLRHRLHAVRGKHRRLAKQNPRPRLHGRARHPRTPRRPGHHR